MASDWKTCTDDKEKYQLYLASREWGLLRAEVHERADGQCERCVFNPIECVHHLSYARKYHEDIADLQGLCNRCHAFTHGRSDDDPALDVCRLELGTNPEFPFLAIALCPICKGRRTQISGARTELYQGVETQRLEVTCRSSEGHEHLFEIMLLLRGLQTAITTTNFRIRKVPQV